MIPLLYKNHNKEYVFVSKPKANEMELPKWIINLVYLALYCHCGKGYEQECQNPNSGLSIHF